jgi:hypothetical protein
MTVQIINIGNRVNDGLGDDLRTAFEKVNSNFSELSSQLTITASNLGETGSSVFKRKDGANLEFRKLIAGRRIGLEELTNSVEIRSTAPDAFYKFDTDSGTITAGSGNELGHITLMGVAAPGSVSGNKDIEVSVLGNDLITFKTIIPVTDILLNFDFGVIDGKYNNAVQLALAQLNLDFGTVLLPSTENFDLGALS